MGLAQLAVPASWIHGDEKLGWRNGWELERTQKEGKGSEQPYTTNPGNTAQRCNAAKGMLLTPGFYREGNGGNAIARPGCGWVCAVQSTGDWSLHVPGSGHLSRINTDTEAAVCTRQGCSGVGDWTQKRLVLDRSRAKGCCP